LSEVHFKGNGTMIGMFGLRENKCPAHQRFYGLAYHFVVDAPAQVFAPGIGAEAPPGIIVGFLVKMAERVHKSAVDKPAQPFAFFGQEAGTGGISYGIVDVDGFMTDVIIAADDQVGACFL